MPDRESDTPLERLNKRLYSAKSMPTGAPSGLAERKPVRASGWDPKLDAPRGKPMLAPSVVFLLSAFGFFIVAGLVAVGLLIMGGRSVSTDNIRITVDGPTKVAGGDTLTLLITIRNQNPVAIENGNLSLSFPEGTYSAEDSTLPLSHYVEEIGDIPAGGSAKKTIRAVVFGNEDEEVSIPMTFEYKTSQSSAVFQRRDAYDFIIGTSPVDVTIATVSEVSSGQELTLSVSVRSNAATPLENVGVLASLPFGFSLNSASPNPSNGTLFTFERIDPGEEAKITLSGVITGEANDERVFRFNVGAIDSSTARSLSTVYATKQSSILITKPFLAVSLLLNRSDADPIVVQAGTPIQSLLSWTNNLSSTIRDGELSVKLSGAALDPESVSSSNGFYRSSDTTVLFNSETDDGLERFEAGDEGNGSFTFSTKTGSAMNALRNPSIILTISVKGKRVGESSVPESISSSVTRTVKIASDLTIAARGVYSVGPFNNAGPWPPKVDQKTTYTIVLTAGNTVNSVAGARASMTLPSYMRFTGATAPADGKITFNDTTREVVWDLGDVPAGTKEREAAFQVELLPSLSQEGRSPVLVGSQEITGFDRFVGRDLSYTAPEVTTRIETDPDYEYSKASVTD